MTTRTHPVPPPEDWPDQGVPWHYGDPFGEQRQAAEGFAVVDRSNLDVIRLTGPDRLDWLNKLVTQQVGDLPVGETVQALILDTHGRVEHHFHVEQTEELAWLITEPGRGQDLLGYLTKMVFWAQVSPEAADGQRVLTVFPAGRRECSASTSGGPGHNNPGEHHDLILSPEEFEQTWGALVADGARPAGTWAFEALRVASLTPRLGLDTDERTLPHEVGWVNPRGSARPEWKAVHLDKGCYRGQETVAKVANVGRAPRHLGLLHLEAGEQSLPRSGEPILDDSGSTVGRLGSAVRHFELGDIALGLVKRGLGAELPLTVAGIHARLDPDFIAGEEEHKPGREAVAKWRFATSPARERQGK